METQHECAVQEAGWRLLSDCPEDGTGMGVWGVVIGVVLLGAVGYGVWWFIQRRA